ncbi:MAG: SDR family NAD(P)-dependent oxidoreductase, partial [Candidatus Muiribacteriaceae bacterium]
MKKRVLICGIAEDITEQICVELISSGHTIVLADTNWELGTRIQEDLSQYGHISFIRGKTADYKEINSLFEKTAGIMGGTDYIINIFRLPEGKDSVYTVSNSEWEKNIAEYINPLFTMSRIWGEKINSSSGCIINIAYKKTPGSYSFQAAFLKDTICSLTEHISKYCPVNA